MGKRVRRAIAFFMVFAVMSGVFSGKPDTLRAASNSTVKVFAYMLPGEDQWTDVEYFLDACYQCNKAGGGKVLIRMPITVGLTEEDQLQYMSGVEIILGPQVILRISECGLYLLGTLRVGPGARLEIENSKGVIHGPGKIINEGEVYKKNCVLTGTEKYRITTQDITYGQKLKDVVIDQDAQKCTGDVKGKWMFLDEDMVPDAGTKLYDIAYMPENKLSYKLAEYKEGALLTVRQDTPLRKEYRTPEIHYGQKLGEAKPEFSYIGRTSGKKVEGELRFLQSQETSLTLGTSVYDAEFHPNNANYCSVTDSLSVRVLPTTPQIVTLPSIRKNGVRGGKLGDIPLYLGGCQNPYSGDIIKGHWEWKNPEESLWSPEKEYEVLFIADEPACYNVVEAAIPVKAELVALEDISFPDCTDILYGQTLGESELSFEKNEYGTFEWENANKAPGVRDKRASVVFTPAENSRYDWSKLAGYDAETGTVKRQIPINVKPVIGTLPKGRAETIIEGDCLSESQLSIESGTAGELTWREPKTVIQESGEKEAVFTPADPINYDWTSFQNSKTGEILLPVEVPVIPRAEVSSEAEYGDRLGDIPLECRDSSYSCRWENAEEILNQSGPVSYPVIYQKDGREYRRMMDLHVKKKGQPAPVGITASNCSVLGKRDGCIHGVNDRMEYRAQTDGVYRAVPRDSTVIDGLTPGKYYVRYQETENYAVGAETEVIIADGLPGASTAEPTIPVSTADAGELPESTATDAASPTGAAGSQKTLQPTGILPGQKTASVPVGPGASKRPAETEEPTGATSSPGGADLDVSAGETPPIVPSPTDRESIRGTILPAMTKKPGSGIEVPDSAGTKTPGSELEVPDSAGTKTPDGGVEAPDPAGTNSPGSGTQTPDPFGTNPPGSGTQTPDPFRTNPPGSGTRTSDPTGTKIPDGGAQGADPFGTRHPGNDTEGDAPTGTNPPESGAQAPDPFGTKKPDGGAQGTDPLGTSHPGNDTQTPDSTGTNPPGNGTQAPDPARTKIPDSVGTTAPPVRTQAPGVDTEPTDPARTKSPDSEAETAAPVTTSPQSETPPVGTVSTKAPDSGMSAIPPASAEEPVIITKMATRLSELSSSGLSVIPAKEKIKKIKRKGRRATVTCKKMQGVRYQIQYSMNRKFKRSKKAIAVKPRFSVRKLRKKQTYYFRVRAWRKLNGQRVYGAWSKVKRA